MKFKILPQPATPQDDTIEIQLSYGNDEQKIVYVLVNGEQAIVFYGNLKEVNVYQSMLPEGFKTNLEEGTP